MPAFVKVAEVSDIPPGTAQCIEVDDIRIAVCNVNGEFYAIDDTCTHDDASLSEGGIDGDEIICPMHEARFNIKTGEVLCPPAFENVNAYPVRIQGADIEIQV